MNLDDIVAWHTSNIGVSGRKGSATRDRAAEILLPNDDPTKAKGYLDGWPDPKKPEHWIIPSVCALYAAGYVRFRCDVGSVPWPHPLEMPYLPRAGRIVADLQEASVALNARTTVLADLAVYPEIGDIWEIDTGSGKDVHFVCPTGTDPATGALVSVDGGQDEGDLVAQCRRLVLFEGGKTWFVHEDAPRLPNGAPNGRYAIARIVGSRLPG